MQSSTQIDTTPVEGRDASKTSPASTFRTVLLAPDGSDWGQGQSITKNPGDFVKTRKEKNMTWKQNGEAGEKVLRPF